MMLFVNFVLCLLPISVITFILPGYQENTKENIIQLMDGSYDDHPEVISGQFDGDIILNEEQAEMMNNAETYGSDEPITYNGLLNGKWKTKEIPVLFEQGTFSTGQILFIHAQFKKIQTASRSCISFVLHTDEPHFIGVTGRVPGCFSNVGEQVRGRITRLNLYPETCMSSGTILHEIIHTLGFFHMHSASVRDQYVNILWDNMLDRGKSNYNIISRNFEVNFGYPYDFNSIMHYPPGAFAKQLGLTTMEPKVNYTTYKRFMGQRDGMTRNDLGKIFRMYQCNVNETLLPINKDGIVIIH